MPGMLRMSYMYAFLFVFLSAAVAMTEMQEHEQLDEKKFNVLLIDPEIWKKTF